METEIRQRWVMYVLAAVAAGFGGVTVYAGGRVIFLPEAREAAGHVVPFVVWFNFLAGFFYIAAGLGLWRGMQWAVWLSGGIAAATALVYVGFGVHALTGGDYELRTVAALALRSIVWIGITVLAYIQTARANAPL